MGGGDRGKHAVQIQQTAGITACYFLLGISALKGMMVVLISYILVAYSQMAQVSGSSVLTLWFTIAFEQSDSFHTHSMTGPAGALPPPPYSNLRQCREKCHNCFMIVFCFNQKII